MKFKLFRITRSRIFNFQRYQNFNSDDNNYENGYNQICRTLDFPFLAYFPYFEKIKIGLCHLHIMCVCETFEYLNQSL
jgi:hypothetical protein